jgi:hypothetical protein
MKPFLLIFLFLCSLANAEISGQAIPTVELPIFKLCLEQGGNGAIGFGIEGDTLGEGKISGEIVKTLLTKNNLSSKDSVFIRKFDSNKVQKIDIKDVKSIFIVIKDGLEPTQHLCVLDKSPKKAVNVVYGGLGMKAKINPFSDGDLDEIGFSNKTQKLELRTKAEYKAEHNVEEVNEYFLSISDWKFYHVEAPVVVTNEDGETNADAGGILTGNFLKKGKKVYIVDEMYLSNEGFGAQSFSVISSIKVGKIFNDYTHSILIPPKRSDEPVRLLLLNKSGEWSQVRMPDIDKF